MAESLSGHLAPKNLPSDTPAEAAILNAWKQVLGREDFGVTDNVFLLGGDPLRAERVAQQLKTIGNAAISVKSLLFTPTVREQAALVTRQAGAA
jgi:aryl carrier-like protein